MYRIILTCLCFLYASCGNSNIEVITTNGEDGYNSLIRLEKVITDTNICASLFGTNVYIGQDTNRNNMLDNSEVQDFQIICDGMKGNDAPPTQHTIVEVINLCGDTINVWDEVLLRMADGSILCSFSDNINGYNTRLSLLVSGNYTTSDGSFCAFTIDNDLTVIDQNGNHWYK